MLELLLDFFFFFSICSSPFCFLSTVFHDTFSLPNKILPFYGY